uniref:SH2 domain-containing protein n=1 Tax=Acrobeloides nanus TaxID=290746 RepID=A0A914CSE1_9BILA
MVDEGQIDNVSTCLEGLQNQKWYWGSIPKDSVSAALEGKPDGTFVVRDASTPGDFTLTLRVNGANKLIKILVSEGKCGFTPETLEFRRVVDLVNFYHINSLKEYNAQLEIMLLYPLSKSILTKQKSPKVARDENNKRVFHVLKCQLEGVCAEHDRISRRYDQITIQKATLSEESQRKRNEQVSFEAVCLLFQNNCIKIESELKNCPERDREYILKNLERYKRRSENISQLAKEARNECKKMDADISKIDAELEASKPRLLSLHRKRDSCQSQLARHYTPSQLERLMDDISFLVESEQPSFAELLLRIPVKWDPQTWLSVDSNKENAIQVINHMLNSLPKNADTDGIFLIRPSQTHNGYFALSISMNRTIHSCLIEFRDPKTSDVGGFAFLNTNMFFSTLVDFVRYYSYFSLKDHNPNLDTTLKRPVFLS